MKKFTFLVAFFSCFLHLSHAQPSLLDPTFGLNGIVKTGMGSDYNYSNLGKEVLLQPGGAMYFVFEANGLTMVAKKHADGSADVTYGNNGYSVSFPIYSSHATIQSDGKIVVGGYSLDHDRYYYNDRDFAVARLNTNGTLDSSFNGNGITSTDFGFSESARSLAIQSDGKIVVAGFMEVYSQAARDLAIARYNIDGSLDDTFNGTGMLTLADVNDFIDESANSVAIQADGKIVLGGNNVISRYNSDGSPDNTFNGNVMQVPGFGISAVAIQADGKILTGGSFNDDFAIARYNNDGSPDNSFDNDGMQTTDFGSVDNATAMAIQSNGKIMLAGSTGDGSNNNFAIASYNSDGSVNNNFSVDGRQTIDFNSSNDYANSIAIQPDGRLVALGYTINGITTSVAAARYNADGTPDNSFHGNGLLTDRVTQGFTYYTSTAIQNDAKVLAAGYTWNGVNYDFALVRYNTDGSLDNTFSGDGKQMTDFSLSDDKARAMVIQSDGKILVAGSSGDNFAIARYNTDGSLDNTFDGDGMLTTDFGAADSANSIVIQSDGKILAGGSSGLARYNTNGSLDLTFAVNGKLTAPFVGDYPFNCNSVAIQNGEIIVIGTVDGIYCMVARYDINGSPDNTFGNNGGQILTAIYNEPSRLIGTAIAIQSDGKIVVGGFLEDFFRQMNSQFAIARLNADGTLDNTFNAGITELTSIDYDAYGTSIVLQDDNKIILAGYSYNGTSDDFAIARYNTDGSPDNTFSDDGIENTQVSAANEGIAAIAITGNKLYAAGYGQYPGSLGVMARYLLSEGGPLPVSLLNFTGVLQNTSVLLRWKIATEKNLAKFVIERGADGNSFLPINSVPALSLSALARDYSMVDEQPLQGINFYRLKMVDVDSKFNYSNVVAVKAGTGMNVRIFPNPAGKILYVEANGSSENVVVQVIDNSGRKLKEMKVFVDGQTFFSIDISNFSTGMYNLVLHKSDKTEVKRFIKK